MARPPLFPALGAESPLAGVQFRQTLALGLVPLGLALLRMAATAPDWPPAGLWFGAAAAPAGMATLWILWRRAGRNRLFGYSSVHFLVRYLFVVLCPALLWFAFGATVLELQLKACRRAVRMSAARSTALAAQSCATPPSSLVNSIASQAVTR